MQIYLITQNKSDFPLQESAIIRVKEELRFSTEQLKKLNINLKKKYIPKYK